MIIVNFLTLGIISVYFYLIQRYIWILVNIKSELDAEWSKAEIFFKEMSIKYQILKKKKSLCVQNLQNSGIFMKK